jgi:phosphoribosylformylglycinamidine synthase
MVCCAAAEMAFGSNYGIELSIPLNHDAGIFLFSETPSRLLVEVKSEHRAAFEQAMGALCVTCIGKTTKKPLFSIKQNNQTIIQETMKNLKESWQKPLQSL